MLTLTDLFAGAGGSSTGAVAVPGVEIRVASNHWQKAVDVHNANHPDAEHVCADISQINPRRFPKTDLLWASPECTWHSGARGRRYTGQPDLFGEVLPDEAGDRSRATMWDVVRFTEAHQYQSAVVENVVEIRRWPPYRAWLMAMHSLGYEHHEVYLNSMHAQLSGMPAPQSRDRIYVVFWRKGNKAPDFGRLAPKAYCPSCRETVESVQAFKRERWGRYRAQYVYRCPKVSCRGQEVEPGWLPAATAIDWSIPGTRIGDRKRPLVDKTRARIAAGIARYWQQPLVMSYYSREDATRPVTRELPTVMTEPRHALIAPYYGTSDSARPDSDPLGTLTTRDRFALITRHYSTRPGEDPAGMTTPVLEPMRTLTTSAQQSIITPGDLSAAEARVDDCYYRMFEPHESAAGMAFPSDYRWDGATKTEQTRMAGNAVTPPSARDVIAVTVAAVAA